MEGFGRGTIVLLNGKEMRVGFRRYDEGFKQNTYDLFAIEDVDEKQPTKAPESSLTFVRLKGD